MEEKIQSDFAAFLSSCDFGRIPEKFREDAKLRILDWVGCACSGAFYPQVEICEKYFEKLDDRGDCSVVRHAAKRSLRTAAYLNGIAGHVCELDDGHRTAIGHPGSITVPVALAVSEKYGLSGKDALLAVILGYETYVRTGRTVNPSHYKTWHTTGTCGTLAACAAASSLLKLNPEQCNNALGLACTMAGGLVESFGSHAKAVNIAEACQNGIDAAELASLGLTGSHSALLGKKGFIYGTSEAPKIENLQDLGEDKLVSDTAFFKIYSSCGHTNSPLDMVFKILNENDVKPEEVESVEVETYKISVDLTSELKVKTEDEAKFSLPYCIALAISFRSVSLPYFAEKYRTDPKVLELAGKVKVAESPEATARFPSRQAEVRIRLKDGRVLTAKTLEASDAATPEMVIDKFRAAVPFYSKEQQDKIIAFVLSVEEQPRFADLIQLLQ